VRQLEEHATAFLGQLVRGDVHASTSPHILLALRFLYTLRSGGAAAAAPPQRSPKRAHCAPLRLFASSLVLPARYLGRRRVL